MYSVENNKSERKIKTAVYIAAVIAAAVLISAVSILLCFELSPKCNPERAVKAYVNGAEEMNWKKVYNVSDFGKGKPFTRKAFADYCAENSDALKLINGKIADYEISLDKAEDDLLYYTVDYVDENGTPGSFYMQVRKTADGFWRFDEYKVIPALNSFPCYTVFAPIGTVITVNDVEMELSSVIESVNPITAEKYSYAKYVAEFIPQGEYDLVAKNKMCNDAVQKINVTENNDENALSLEMKLNEESFNELAKSAEELIGIVYNGVRDGSLKAESLPLSKSFTQKKLERLIKNISNEMLKDTGYYKITAFSVDKAQLQSSYSDIILNPQCENKITISYKFDYGYIYESDYKGTGEYTKGSRNDTGYFSIVYTLENGEWKIDEIMEQAWF